MKNACLDSDRHCLFGGVGLRCGSRQRCFAAEGALLGGLENHLASAMLHKYSYHYWFIVQPVSACCRNVFVKQYIGILAKIKWCCGMPV